MQNLVHCLSMIGVLGFLLIGFQHPVVGQSASQSQTETNPANRPMTLPQFELYLKNRTPPRRLADEIRRRGVDFTVDLKFIDSLSNRGVGAEVIESLIAFVDDAAIYGTLAVSAAQSQVSIQVDGIGVFQQSMNQQVPEGSYLVTVTAPGFVTRKYRVGVKAGQVTNLVPKMASVIDLNQLMNAAREGNKDKLKKVIERGVDPNIQDSQGFTALMFASQGGHDGCVRKLLDLGADPSLVNNYNRSAYDLARDGDIRKILSR